MKFEVKYEHFLCLQKISHFVPTTSMCSTQLSHWGRDKMTTVSQTTFWNVCYWIKMYEFWLRIHWGMFLKGLINYISSLVQIMAWRCPGAKPLSEPMMVKLPNHICVTRPQWVKQNTWVRANIQSNNTNYFHADFMWNLVRIATFRGTNPVRQALKCHLSC